MKIKKTEEKRREKEKKEAEKRGTHTRGNKQVTRKQEPRKWKEERKSGMTSRQGQHRRLELGGAEGRKRRDGGGRTRG